jgi:Zn finger protein HypA/HybF involved in hydrogenase expression
MTNTATTTAIECGECMARFRRTITPRTVEIRCPKCGGYDTIPVDLLGAGRVG